MSILYKKRLQKNIVLTDGWHHKNKSEPNIYKFDQNYRSPLLQFRIKYTKKQSRQKEISMHANIHMYRIQK